jgi:glutaredoxin
MQAGCITQGSLIFALLIAGAAQAQTLYRWTDEKGRVHVTDTPPPASARNVQKPKLPAGTGATAEQLPFETALAMQDFPVTLYTFPNCEEPCTRAREALNKRGVPFREIQVSDQAKMEELKKVSGSMDAPTLIVGQSVHKGFEQSAYDALLDAARYPKTGSAPARNQPRPNAENSAKADTAKPAAAAEEEKPAGPYSPGSRPPRRLTPQKQ